MYSYLKEIDRTDLMIYAIIIIIVAVIISRINPSPLVVFALIIGLIVAYFLNDMNNTANNVYVKRLIDILKSPDFKTDRNQYLYKDAILVEFLDIYREYKEYNPSVFNSLVKNINNFLKLADDIERGTVNYMYDYDVMINTKTKILNDYHSFIHSVPHASVNIDKYHTGSKKLLSLLNEQLMHTNRLVLNRSQASGIHIETKFHYRNHPKPTDPTWDAKYNFHSSVC